MTVCPGGTLAEEVCQGKTEEGSMRECPAMAGLRDREPRVPCADYRLQWAGLATTSNEDATQPASRAQP